MQADNVRNYAIQKTDRFFFDANVWLLIFDPTMSIPNERTRAYSNFYRDIISKGIKIYIDLMVLSEIINRSSRIHFDHWKKENLEQSKLDYKKYRETEDYRLTIRAVESVVQSILVDCAPLSSTFTDVMIRNVLSDLVKGNSDFNDLIIVDLCRSNNLTLVTDDGDFRNASIPILTYNRKLLLS